ncbi:hypothetical protein J2S13_001317 [Oikeobacillus pervagus]|uniref:Uncharacterized protein n=1 Tax=Oikeobacillus pervagus TaxID=1325931 RepID=A0AAJ1WJ14_9BACI|nr:hypothetical protein [Oikeobacillus pervagus]MDQ0214918.1 hypothetical protein [Oikeobacillus pervagus]
MELVILLLAITFPLFAAFMVVSFYEDSWNHFIPFAGWSKANHLYFCKKCGQYSREYQLILHQLEKGGGRVSDLEHSCPHCRSKKQMQFVDRSRYRKWMNSLPESPKLGLIPYFFVYKKGIKKVKRLKKEQEYIEEYQSYIDSKEEKLK